jgi:putative tricarboxylic transport membrane protein
VHVALDDWIRRPRSARNAALVPGALVFYVLLADVLGFFLTSAIFLLVLWLAFGAAHRWLAPLALVIVLVIHYSFYTLLGVPLPWGLLEPLAW